MRFIADISIEEVGTVCNRFFDYDDGDFGRSHGNGYGHRRYSHDLIMAR